MLYRVFIDKSVYFINNAILTFHNNCSLKSNFTLLGKIYSATLVGNIAYVATVDDLHHLSYLKSVNLLTGQPLWWYLSSTVQFTHIAYVNAPAGNLIAATGLQKNKEIIAFLDPNSGTPLLINQNQFVFSGKNLPILQIETYGATTNFPGMVSSLLVSFNAIEYQAFHSILFGANSPYQASYSFSMQNIPEANISAIKDILFLPCPTKAVCFENPAIVVGSCVKNDRLNHAYFIDYSAHPAYYFLTNPRPFGILAQQESVFLQSAWLNTSMAITVGIAKAVNPKNSHLFNLIILRYSGGTYYDVIGLAMNGNVLSTSVSILAGQIHIGMVITYAHNHTLIESFSIDLNQTDYPGAAPFHSTWYTLTKKFTSFTPNILNQYPTVNAQSLPSQGILKYLNLGAPTSMPSTHPSKTPAASPSSSPRSRPSVAPSSSTPSSHPAPAPSGKPTNAPQLPSPPY